jgi:glucokinase
MYAIGVDIGGTKIGAGVVDADGTILAKTRVKTDATDGDAVDAAVVEVCRRLMADWAVDAVGLAAPGFIGSDRSTVLFTPNLPWRDHPLRAVVATQLPAGVEVVVENDANAAGWAEFRFGVAKDVTDMVTLTLGTGLGGAVITNGALVRGSAGVAAEIGHLRVVQGGHPCGCGQSGCWEQYVSGSALERYAREAARDEPERAAALLEQAEGDWTAVKGKHVTRAAAVGDPLAIELLARIGTWLGTGAASVSALLDPALYVVGGGLSGAGELVMAPARAAFAANMSARGHHPEAAFAVAAMGNDAGIVGAADLARS